MVLIPKGDGGEFHRIGLVEVLWMNMMGLLNRLFTLVIWFHNVLQGFQTVRRTGNASHEAKLLQQLKSMRETVLHKIFLDLQKAYDALDWNLCLDILAVYVVVPREIQLLLTYWVQLTMVYNAREYYAPPTLKGCHGVTQGDPCSPWYLTC